ncbi:MAG: VOC family protein [Candidatus Nitrosotenuis sp.]
MTRPIPEGYNTITVSLAVKNASDAIEFYKKAFGAQELSRFLMPDEKTIMHAQIKIGNSILMLADEMPNMGCLSPQTLGGTAMSLFMYVEDADKTFAQAVAAGAQPLMPMMDAFWGDRFGSIQDPFGHIWGIATHKHDLAPEQIKKAGLELFKNVQKPA